MNERSDQSVLIDRLAAGELSGGARRDLFVWLDGEPSRWRRCAMALLEARELEHAFSAWQAEVPKPTVKLSRTPEAPHFQRGALFALAASIMIAFSLGIFARGFWIAPAPMFAESPASSGRDVSSVATDRQPSSDLVKRPEIVPDKGVTAVAAAPPMAAQSDLIPPYVRSQLERRGYQVKSRHALLPVVLPDGRRVTLPIDELQLNYVGHRAY
jgi:hypothetical protein